MCIYEVVEKGQSDLNDDLNDYEYNLTLIKYILYISDKKLLVEQRIPQTKTLLRRRLTKMMMKLKLYKHDLDFECHVVRILKYCNVKMGWNLCFIKRSKYNPNVQSIKAYCYLEEPLDTFPLSAFLIQSIF